MLPKRQRLNLKKDFKWVREGKKIYLPELNLFVRGSAQVDDPRIGIALSKHSFREAVERSRARRLTSKAVENIYSRLRKHLKLVIIPKTVVLQKTSEELSKILENVKDITKPD